MCIYIIVRNIIEITIILIVNVLRARDLKMSKNNNYLTLLLLYIKYNLQHIKCFN